MFDNEDQELELEVDATIDEAEEEGEELETEVEEIEEETEGSDEEELEDDGDDNGEEEEAEAAALTVTIEGEEDDEPEDGNAVIRNFREERKELVSKVKDLEAKLKSFEAPEAELGEKPTLEAFDYDAERFEAALLDWNERKRAADAKQAEQQKQQEEARERYNKRLEGYQAEKVELKAKDFDEAEEAVLGDFSKAQQSIIVARASKPALVVYALGKNKKVRERLAKSEDLAEFAYELGKLESKMTVTGTAKAKPEKRLKGTKGAALSGDKKLEQLEAEADRTGDRTKVQAYKREMSRRKG